MSSTSAVEQYRAHRWFHRIPWLAIAVPGFLIIWSILVIVPLLVVVVFSFFQMRSFQIIYDPTLEAWRSLIETGRWLAAARTLRIAVTMTILELLLAFPFALWLAKGCNSKYVKAIIITLLTIPFFLDTSSRVIIWRAILGTSGIVNTTLVSLHVISKPITWLLYSEFSVHFGMLGSYFPTMVFPIFMIITLIDDDYLQASADLGASPGQTLLNVVIPLSLPGIMAGVVFTLVPLMAAFIEPQMLGGGFVNLLGDSVNSALQELKYPTAAALSTVVVALLSLGLAGLVLTTRKKVNLSTIFQAVQK
jgi:ABC-type spermidine/putrescine transport system permease subunit I